MADTFKILSTRTARNVFFWILVVLFFYELNADAHAYPRPVYLMYKFFSISILAVLTCINNLVLVPRLLAQKKRLWYLLAAAGLLMVMSAVYVVLFKDMLQRYPHMEIYEVSILVSPISDNWSLSAIAEEIPTFAFGLLMWLAAFTMAWYMQAYARQEQLAKDAAYKQVQAELGMLRGQLNPHFLFNTLNNIYGLSLQKSDLAPESILKLAAIMRYILYESDIDTVPFDKEKELMQAYIDMELLRLQDKNNFTFVIQADADYRIPPLLWLPVLENVFKHGTRVIAGHYFINYQFSIAQNVITITAENNRRELTEDNNTGLGLSNLRKRLEILYPDNHSIVVQQDEERYRIEVIVSLS
jgi:hypothetical protein